GLVEAINVCRQFLRLDDSRVVAGDAVDWIGEPDRVVGRHYNVIRRIEAFAFKLVDQGRDRAIVFGSAHAPAGMFASEQPTLSVAGQAVRLACRLAEHTDLSGLLIPAGDPVERGIRPEQISAIAKPDRSLGPAHAGGETFNACIVEAIFG